MGVINHLLTGMILQVLIGLYTPLIARSKFVYLHLAGFGVRESGGGNSWPGGPVMMDMKWKWQEKLKEK